VSVTDPQGQGDKDPVSQFSDPTLMHSFAEAPQPYAGQAPAGPAYPAYRAYGSGGAPTPAWPSVRSRWFLAIISIFLFWPVGIAALVYATRVRVLAMRGDVAGALRASKRVKVFFWISLAIFVVFIVIALVTQSGSSSG
jgi:Interferon-induced transmembrane protein